MSGKPTSATSRTSQAPTPLKSTPSRSKEEPNQHASNPRIVSSKSSPSKITTTSNVSQVSQPVAKPLKVQNTGQSVASTTSTVRSAKTATRPNPAAPSRAKTPSTLTRSKTPSGSLYAPTAASLAKARDAAPTVPTTTTKRRASIAETNAVVDRLTKPTAASASKARTVQAPVSTTGARGTTPAVRGSKPIRATPTKLRSSIVTTRTSVVVKTKPSTAADASEHLTTPVTQTATKNVPIKLTENSNVAVQLEPTSEVVLVDLTEQEVDTVLETTSTAVPSDLVENDIETQLEPTSEVLPVHLTEDDINPHVEQSSEVMPSEESHESTVVKDEQLESESYEDDVVDDTFRHEAEETRHIGDLILEEETSSGMVLPHEDVEVEETISIPVHVEAPVIDKATEKENVEESLERTDAKIAIEKELEEPEENIIIPVQHASAEPVQEEEQLSLTVDGMQDEDEHITSGAAVGVNNKTEQTGEVVSTPIQLVSAEPLQEEEQITSTLGDFQDKLAHTALDAEISIKDDLEQSEENILTPIQHGSAESVQEEEQATSTVGIKNETEETEENISAPIQHFLVEPVQEEERTTLTAEETEDVLHAEETVNVLHAEETVNVLHAEETEKVLHEVAPTVSDVDEKSHNEEDNTAKLQEEDSIQGLVNMLESKSRPLSIASIPDEE